jgi:hypothetical protein
MSQDENAPQRFAYVDPNSGEIKLTGSVPFKDVDLQTPPKNLLLLTVDADVRSISHKIEFTGLDEYPEAVRLSQLELDQRAALDPVAMYMAAQAMIVDPNIKEISP